MQLSPGNASLSDSPTLPRLIAFYLPQFYPIPENDRWWGRGFTEWTNVVRARPRFEGHYQPRLPADLGFYDLRVPETQIAQAALAREYGISGFCYYHYWFNGQLLLDRPLNQVLTSGQPDFPFCLCWANESWRRNWDGLTGTVLCEQRYDEQDDRNHIAWLAPILNDPRYIRIHGKPLLLIYRVAELPSPHRTAEIWREQARKLGSTDIYLAAIEHGDQPLDPGSIGFDACVEFQPSGEIAPARTFRGNADVYDYADVVSHLLARPPRPGKRFPVVFPSWDNSARRQNLRSMVLHNSSPELYERWLTALVARAQSAPGDERLIFINAWNEWSEGAHLEPDLRFGRAYLEATRRALKPGTTPLDLAAARSSGELYRPGDGPVVQLSAREETENLRSALRDSLQLQEQLRRQVEVYQAERDDFMRSRAWRLFTLLGRLRRALPIRPRKRSAGS